MAQSALFITSCVVVMLGCEGSTVESPFVLNDAAMDAGATPEVEDGGVEGGPELGKPCLDDEQCDDGIDCTFDECVPGVLRCRTVPNHSKCADNVYCNGVEQCDPLLGCREGPPITCSDGTPCTIDRCVESSQSCVYEQRDADGDGDIDHLCVGEGDCDDSDPTVSSQHPEVCGNGKDDNCDGEVDEADCEPPLHDTCEAPLMIGASGSYDVSTIAASRDYAAGCLSTEAASHDLVLFVEVPEQYEGDVDIVAIAPNGDLWLAEFEDCGVLASEEACMPSGVTLNGESVTRLRLREPSPGLHTVVLFSERASAIALSVRYEDAVPVPSNETCNSSIPLVAEVPAIAHVRDARRDVPTVCGMLYGELVYSITLDEPADVRLTARSLDGLGEPQVSLQGDGCLLAQASEVTCRRGDGALLFSRALPAGTYFAAVGATGPSDVEVSLELSEPSEPSEDESCQDPPPLPFNEVLTVDLNEHTDDVFAGCLPGGVDAVYELSISDPSDVLLIERFAAGQVGAINLFDFPCATHSDRLSCTVSNLTPVRTAIHNLQPGSYAAVVEASLPTAVTLTALRRPASAPSIVAFADTCATALEIPPDGGFFQGNTANATANYGAGCDLPSQGEGGAREQMLKLVLEEEKRVVLDMLGSAYSTLLAVREGPGCPGEQVPNGCSAGVQSDRSYLDLTLAAGEYYVQVDGFAREEGQWFLDVYVVDP